MAKSARVSRRRMAGLLVGLTGLALAGCGGGDDLDPLGLVDEEDPTDGDGNGSSGGGTPGGSGNGGSGSPGTLYEAFKGLRSGMTKSQVIAYVPVRPSQGADTNQVLWVKGEEALGVKFNGSSSGSIITFAQWGLSIEAGGRDETRNF